MEQDKSLLSARPSPTSDKPLSLSLCASAIQIAASQPWRRDSQAVPAGADRGLPETVARASGLTLIGAAPGPIIPGAWILIATADFNGDGKPDYALYNGSTRQTAIWYLNNNVYVGSAFGPTPPTGWSLTAP